MKTLFVILTVLETLLHTLSTNTLISDINMQISASASQPIIYTGSMAMKGECFKIDIMDLTGAYDGQTLAIYQKAADELTFSIPTREELTQVNPLLFLQTVLPLCNTTERASKKTDETIITLTPKNTQPASGAATPLSSVASGTLANEIKDIKKVVLRVNNSNMMLRSIEIMETGTTSTLLSADDYPDAYINDLR